MLIVFHNRLNSQLACAENTIFAQPLDLQKVCIPFYLHLSGLREAVTQVVPSPALREYFVRLMFCSIKHEKMSAGHRGRIKPKLMTQPDEHLMVEVQKCCLSETHFGSRSTHRLSSEVLSVERRQSFFVGVFVLMWDAS